jgi:hypothetical protein
LFIRGSDLCLEMAKVVPMERERRKKAKFIDFIYENF